MQLGIAVKICTTMVKLKAIYSLLHMVVLNCLILCNHCQETNVSLCERKTKKNDSLVKGDLTTETKIYFYNFIFDFGVIYMPVQ